MRSIFSYTLLFLLLSVVAANAQAPQLFNYQAVARDAVGTPLASKTIKVQIEIYEGDPSASGTLKFSEIHNSVLTNLYGLFNLQIGSKLNGTGNMASVSWKSSSVYVKIYIDPGTGTFSAIGDGAQLLSVPYAIYSNESFKATTVSGQSNGFTVGTGILISGNTISGDNTTKLWNANKLYDKGLSPAMSAPETGSILVYSDPVWAPSLKMDGFNTGTNLISGLGATSVTGNLISGVKINTPFATGSGTGISVNNNVIANTAPDRIVTITGIGPISVGGSYPNFTLSVPSAIAYTPGTGISISGGVISNTSSITSSNLTVAPNASGFSIDAPLAGTSTNGLLSSGDFNTIQKLSTFDIQSGNNINVSKSGTNNNIYTIGSVARTLSYSGNTLSILGGNSISLPPATTATDGLMTAANFNTLTSLSTIVGSQWTSNNLNIYYNTGNVGIGTLTPSEKLTVLGNASVSGSVFIGNVSAPAVGIIKRIGIDNTGKLVDITGSANFGNIQGSGPVTVTGAGATNSIWGGNATISIALATLSSDGLLSQTDFQKLQTLTSGIIYTGLNAATVNGTTIDVPIVNLTGTAVSGTYPNYTINTVPGTVYTGLNAVTVNGTTIDVPIVNLTGTAVSGTYPNYTINTVPGTVYTGLNAATVNGTTIDVPIVNLTGTAVSGTYPNYTINTVPGTVYTGLNAATVNGTTIDVPIVNLTGTAVTGTYPNYTINTIPGAVYTGLNAATVNGSNIDVPFVTLTGTGITTVTGTYPNFVITTPTVGGVTYVGLNAATVNGSNIDVPFVTLTGTGITTVTGSYPNFVITTPTVGGVTYTGLNAATVNGTTIDVPIVSLTGTAVTGTYPNYIVNTVPGTVYTGLNAATVNGSNIDVPFVTLTGTGITTVTGTYPNFVITTPTVGGITYTGLNAATVNGTTIDVPIVNLTGTAVTGTYPNYIVNTVPGTVYTGLNAATVTGSNIDVPFVTLTGTGITTVTGTYPNFVITTPTVGGITYTGLNAATVNGSNINVPFVTLTGTGITTVTGTYPNFVITTPTVGGITYIGLNAATVNGTTIDVPIVNLTGTAVTGTYPNYIVNTVPGTVYTGLNAATVNGSNINVPFVTLTGTGITTVTGTYPNFVITTPTVGGITYTGLNAATVNGSNINVPFVTLTGTGITTVTGTFPNFVITTPTVGGINYIGLNAATVSGSNINVPFVTLTGTGITTVTGTYPNFVITTPTTPGIVYSGINAVTVSGTQINVPIVTVSGNAVSGSYPNFIVNSTTTITGIGPLITVTSSLGNYSIAGIAQTLSLSGSVLALSNGGTVTLPGSNISLTGVGPLITVTSSLGNYSIAGIAQTLSLSGNNLSISGASGSVKLPITTLIGSGFVTTTNTSTGITTYSISGLSQWLPSTTGGIYYTTNVGIGNSTPQSTLDLISNDPTNAGVNIVNYGGNGLNIVSTGTGITMDSEINGIDITANTGYGIQVQTYSPGSWGIQSTATTSGQAIWGIISGTSGSPGSAIQGTNSIGNGYSGNFENYDPTNNNPTVIVTTVSDSPGIKVSSAGTGISVINNTGDGINVLNNSSTGTGIYVDSQGSGILINSTGTDVRALSSTIDISGAGNAGVFENLNSTNTFNPVYIGTNSTTAGLFIISSASGIALEIGKGTLQIDDFLPYAGIGYTVTIDGNGALQPAFISGGFGPWTPTGSTLSDIYYGAGKVGIGNSSPSSNLDILATNTNDAAATIINQDGTGLSILSQYSTTTSATGLIVNSYFDGIISQSSNGTAIAGIGASGQDAILGIAGAGGKAITGFVDATTTGIAGYFENINPNDSNPTVYISNATSTGVALEINSGMVKISNLQGTPGYVLTVDGTGLIGKAPYPTGSSQWTTDGSLSYIYTNYGTSISGISTVSGLNIQTIVGVASGLALGVDPLTGAVGTISGSSLLSLGGVNLNTLSISGGNALNLPITTLVGSGITASSTNSLTGITTYTISSSNQWTTAGTNMISAYNTSISGISSVGGLNIKSISSISGAYLSINGNGVVGTIAGPSFTPTSVTGVGVSLITSAGLNTYSIPGSQWTNSTATSSGIYYMNKVGIGTTSPGFNLDVVGNLRASLNIIALTNMQSPGIQLTNFNIGTAGGTRMAVIKNNGDIDILPLYTSTSPNLSINSSTGIISIGLTTSIVGSGVSLISTTGGTNTFSISGVTNQWTTAGTNMISAYNTSISGISSVGGLNISSISSIAGAYLSINGNGVVGTIAGPSFTSPLLSLGGVNLNTLSISGGNALNLPITTLVGSGITASSTNSLTGITTYTISSSNQWTTAGTNMISAYNTSITGISSVGGLNIKGVSSISGALLGINSNGAVGTIAGVASQWTTSSTTTPGIFYTGGNVGIGTSTPNKNVALDITSSSAGVLFPRWTSAQRTILGASFGQAEDGLLVYDTDTKNFINYYWTNISTFGWNGGGGGSGNNSYGNVAWNYNSTATGGTISSNNAYAGIFLSTTVAGATPLLQVNGGQLNSGTITTNGLNLSNLTGAGTRFAQVDPTGNLTATTLSGFVQGSNTSTSTSLAIFTGQTSSVTGSNNLTWNSTSSTLGATNIALGTTTTSNNNVVSVYLLNSSGSNLAQGLIVVASSTTNNAFTLTNQEGNTAVIGVTTEPCLSGQVCPIAVSGVIKVLANNAPVRGQHCITSTNVNGSANSIPSPDPGSSIGVWLEANGANTYSNVLLK